MRQCAKKPCRPSTNKPICASNGKIYANDCRFKIAQCRKPSLRIVPQRKCQVVKPTVAKKKKTPVCGSDGKTYPSKKKFQKAKRKFHLRKIEIKIKHKGECGKPLKKSKKGRQCKNGKCRKGPICGNNGIRYKNFRLFRKDKRKKNMYKNLRKGELLIQFSIFQYRMSIL